MSDRSSDLVDPGDAVDRDDAVDLGAVDHDAVGQATGSITRWIALGVGGFVIALVALFATGNVDGAINQPSPLLDRRVPEISATAVDGREYDIDDFRGQWVLVNFFATWCPGCVVEHPELVSLEAWGEANGRLSIVSVAFNEEPTRVQAFFDAEGGSWPVLNDASTSVDFQIRKIPETFLVAPSGLVVQHFIGGIVEEDVVAIIEANDPGLAAGAAVEDGE